MKSRVNQLLFVLRIIGVILGIGFLAYQIFHSLHGYNLSPLAPNFIYIIIALLISLFAIALQMTAWKFILDTIHQNISLLDVFSGFSLSFVTRLIPGTIWGYLTRSDWLKREHDIPYAITNFSSIIETIGFVLTDLFVVLQGLLFARNIYFSLIFSIVFIIGGWASLNFFILWKPTRRLFRLEDNNFIKYPFTKWLAIFILYIALWYSYGVSLTIFARTIEFSLSFEHVLEMSSVFALAWLIGFIVPFLPSGLGLREFSLTILLIAVFGMEEVDATFIAIGFRVIVSIAELLWIIYGISNKTVIKISKLQARK